MERNGHILTSGGTLLGVALAMVAGLKIAGSASKTIADEMAGGGAFLIALALGLSYLSVRGGASAEIWERRADKTYIVGLATLIASVAVLFFADLK